MVGNKEEKLAFSLITLVLLVLIALLLHGAGYHVIKWLFVNIAFIVGAYAHWLWSKIQKDKDDYYGGR